MNTAFIKHMPHFLCSKIDVILFAVFPNKLEFNNSTTTVDQFLSSKHRKGVSSVVYTWTE